LNFFLSSEETDTLILMRNALRENRCLTASWTAFSVKDSQKSKQFMSISFTFSWGRYLFIFQHFW